MGPISMLFPNPAVKILEEHLWEAARKRYLAEHPSDLKDDDRTVMRKVRTAYKDTVAATLKEADHKVRAKWREFKHVMTVDLRTALRTVLRMSDIDWYSAEIGQSPNPTVIAAPYQLLKHMTAALLSRGLRKQIDFEDLDEVTLEALATYAADQKFQDVLEDARRHYESVEIGERRAHFVIAEIIKEDAYFLGEENHHSLIDVVILSSIGATPSDGRRKNRKIAAKRWLDQDRKNRRSDRRFTGDGWEISFEQLKSWATRA
jgi:hypothetical protein